MGSWGKVSTDDVVVSSCDSCHLARLKEISDQKAFYESAEYRESYNDSVDVGSYFKMHDDEQPGRLQKIGLNIFRGATFVDYGCGGGAFLDLVKGSAAKTIAIEPCREFHASLEERGHQVFADDRGAIREFAGQVDILTSFGVIEHTENPLQYLQSIKSLLKPGGRAYIETDNLNDILMVAGPESFKQFFYRNAHLWYFSADSLSELVKKSGLEVVRKEFRHNYDLSNFMVWLKESRPSGVGAMPLFDRQLDDAWKGFLEANGFAELIFLEARNLNAIAT